MSDGPDTRSLRALMRSWLIRADAGYRNGLIARAIDRCANDLLKCIEAAEDDEDDKFLPPPAKAPVDIPRPVWLIGPEPDWAATSDCWWGEADADQYTCDDCEEAIQETLAQMDEYPDELELEAHRTEVIAANDPDLCPLTLAERMIETLDEDFKWHEDYDPNPGTAAIQEAAHVFCAAVRKHYVVGIVGDTVATVRVDVRKWVTEEDPGMAAELGWVTP